MTSTKLLILLLLAAFAIIANGPLALVWLNYDAIIAMTKPEPYPHTHEQLAPDYSIKWAPFFTDDIPLMGERFATKEDCIKRWGDKGATCLRWNSICDTKNDGCGAKGIDVPETTDDRCTLEDNVTPCMNPD